MCYIQVPGVIIMQLSSAEGDSGEGTYDPDFKRIIVIFNALPYIYEQEIPKGESQHNDEK